MPALALQMLPHTQAPWITSGSILRIGTVLRSLQIVETLPARLRAAERFPIEFDIEALGGEVPLLHGDEIVQPHALGGDLDAMQWPGHRFLPVGYWRFCSRPRLWIHE